MISTASGKRTGLTDKPRDERKQPRAVMARQPFVLPASALEWPESPLAQAFSDRSNGPHLFLVTGLRGIGKTTWCGELVRLAQARGLRVAGLWSPAVFTDSRKSGIDLVDLATGQRRRLATSRGNDPVDAAVAAVSTIQWAFDPATIAWGNEVLANLPENDMLVIDELGPLELIRGEGLAAALDVLDSRAYRVAFVVIRPSLLAEADRRWPHAQVITPRQIGDDDEAD
jgi:nucleoside-triphosphatase THEP1